MAEQRCIICGNIVRFGHGQRVAVCEYCETRQELNEGFEETAPSEPIIKAQNTLERAKKLSVDKTTQKKYHAEERIVGSTVSTKTDLLFKDIDDKDEELWTEEEKEVVNSTSTNARIVAIVILVMLIVVFMCTLYGCETF